MECHSRTAIVLLVRRIPEFHAAVLHSWLVEGLWPSLQVSAIRQLSRRVLLTLQCLNTLDVFTRTRLTLPPFLSPSFLHS